MAQVQRSRTGLDIRSLMLPDVLAQSIDVPGLQQHWKGDQNCCRPALFAKGVSEWSPLQRLQG